MARIVLACWGSYGDLFPSLGLARGLAARGHQALVATCPVHREVVELAEVPFRPLRPDIDPADAALLRRVMDPRRGSEVVVREIAAAGVKAAYDDLSEAVDGADLIVSHPITFAAPLVAERLRLPWISTVLSPISFFSAYDFPVPSGAAGLARLARLGPWVGRWLNRAIRATTRSWTAPVRALRAEMGLPDAGNPLFDGQFSPFGTLVLFSRVLAEPQPDWPARTTQTGFVFYGGPVRTTDEVLRFLDAGDPPIVFTLGTSAVTVAGSFYDESVRAAAALGRRAILLTGRQPENRPAGPLPDGVLAVDFAPHDALFPRAAAIVHQGGIGTMGQALRSGRPMLVVPHAHDQPDNAARARRLGVARVLPPERYAGARLVRELGRLLDDPAYAEAARSTAEVVRREDGMAAACEAIERVLDGGR